MGDADRRQHPDRRSTSRGGRRAGDPQPDWITVTAFARRYGVDRATVYKWLEAGLLVTYRVGNILRIRNVAPNEHADLIKSAAQR